jgi:hypothetical protein
MGSFLIMGLFGLIIWRASSTSSWPRPPAVRDLVIGVLIFAGLTAYDTQKIKEMYFRGATAPEMAEKLAIYGALQLYMDFLGMFQMLHEPSGQPRISGRAQTRTNERPRKRGLFVCSGGAGSGPHRENGVRG